VPSYTNSGDFSATGGANAYRLEIEARTSQVTGGTLVEIFAQVVKFRDHGNLDTFSSNGTRSWSLPGGRQDSTSGTANASGSSSWSYFFSEAGIPQTQNVYNYFNRYIPYSYGSSTTLTVSAAGSGSGFLTSRSVSVSVPLFSAPVTAPTAPTSLSASTTRTDGINLSWSGASGTITNYGIWWNNTASGAPSSSSTPDFTTTSTTFLDTTVSAGSERFYWVRAQGSGGNSAWFPSGDGRRGFRVAPTPPPSQPTGLSITNQGQSSLTMAWNSVSGATGYYIYRGGTYLGAISSTSYNFTGLTASTTYTLGVAAYNDGGSSTISTIQATTLANTFLVPNVVGQTNTAAVTNLTNAGFASVTQVNTTVNATAANNRRVSSQTPVAGDTVATGSSATITIFDYKLAVPNILGQTQTEANTSLTNAGFLFRSSTTTTAGATVANNLLVASQTPTGGTQYNIADNVSYVIYNFLTAVPNVIGQLQDIAVTNLNNLGFKTITVTLDENGATALNVGTVKSQTPTNSATTYNPANTSVSLVVYSLGITGKRFTGTGFTPLTNAKRYTGTEWKPLTVQKRFNGTAWIDIAN
jgi:beta-lactam-binding protein with PASTA domain